MFPCLPEHDKNGENGPNDGKLEQDVSFGAAAGNHDGMMQEMSLVHHYIVPASALHGVMAFGGGRHDEDSDEDYYEVEEGEDERGRRGRRENGVQQEDEADDPDFDPDADAELFDQQAESEPITPEKPTRSFIARESHGFSTPSKASRGDPEDETIRWVHFSSLTRNTKIAACCEISTSGKYPILAHSPIR